MPVALHSRASTEIGLISIPCADLHRLQFVHWKTDVFDQDPLVPGRVGADDSLCGRTTWMAAAHLDGGENTSAPGSPTDTASLQWGWVRIRPSVIVMTNPLEVQSNLRLLADADEAPLQGPTTCIHLNRVIHGLGWQSRIERTLARLSEPHI